MKDFMNNHKFNYNFLNETTNKNSSIKDKLLCVLFITPLSETNENELSQFDLVIAYDTTFDPKKHLLHIKTNKTIPIIRLVSENTLEHALNYEMLQNQDNFSFSNLSSDKIKRIMSFGLINKEVGRNLSDFDFQGICNQVFQWIKNDMSRNLTFGMENAVRKDIVEKEWIELTSVKAVKRVFKNDDDNFQKKKLKKTSIEASDSSSKLLSSTTSLQINFTSLKKTQSQKNSGNDLSNFNNSKDPKKNDKGISINSNNDNNDSNKEQNIEWKQKYMELEAQFKEITREKDELVKKRKRSSISQKEIRSIKSNQEQLEAGMIRHKNSKLRSNIESKEKEIQKLKKEKETKLDELNKIRTELANVKSNAESKDQEIQNLIKERDTK
ncbi:hypothetical protein C1645_829948, partial [Glomus cerebriforme]